MYRRSRFLALFIALAILPLSGCLFRSSHPVQMRISTAQLKDASLDQLVESINVNAGRLNSFKATVDIDTSVKQKKGKAKDYPQFRGIVLVRKPNMMRLILQVPVLRDTAADIVSNQNNFQVSIPSRKEFRVGSNQTEGKPSPNWFENLRPQHIKDALLLRPIDSSAGESAILEDGTEIVKDPKSHKDVQQATYVVTVNARDNAGYFLSRKVVFSRTDLLPHEQMIYGRSNQLITEARYENFANHAGILFPDIIEVHMPVEGYTITLSVVKLNLNEPLTDEQFVLAQPPDYKLINMDDKQGADDSRSALHNSSSQERPR